MTGGLDNNWNTLQRVTKYSLTGEVTELPDLNTRRRGHACSRFVNTEGVTVSYKHVIRVDFKSIFSIFSFILNGILGLQI